MTTENISSLPADLHEFSGEVIIAEHTPEHLPAIEDFVAEVRRIGVAGLDLEWRMDMPGTTDNNPIALLQFSTFTKCLLLRTHVHGLPDCIRELLCDPTVIKAVASFDLADAMKLSHSFDLTVDVPRHDYLDIAVLADELQLPSRGLKKVVTHCGFNMRKAFNVCRSDWAKEEPLSRAQVQYAADDAYFTLLACLPLLKELKECSAERAAALEVLERHHNTSKAQMLDNSEYRAAFIALRDAVLQVLEKETRPWIDAAELQGSKPVKSVMRAHKCITLCMSFFIRNRDVFAVRNDREQSRLLIRLRREGDMEEAPPADEEQEAALYIKVLKGLTEQQPGQWVLRTQLSACDDDVVEDVVSRLDPTVDFSWEAESGLLLRLKNHPRASKASAKQVCYEKVLELTQLDEATVRDLVEADEKVRDLSHQFVEVEKDSIKEKMLLNHARARGFIISDAWHLQKERELTDIAAIKFRLEADKMYRKSLGLLINVLSNGHTDRLDAARQAMRQRAESLDFPSEQVVKRARLE